MTPTELDDALDAMAAAAGDDPDKQPGLITVQSDHWVAVLSGCRATIKNLVDGLRHRNIQIAVSSTHRTEILTRAQAGAAGEPYRDLTPRA